MNIDGMVCSGWLSGIELLPHYFSSLFVGSLHQWFSIELYGLSNVGSNVGVDLVSPKSFHLRTKDNSDSLDLIEVASKFGTQMPAVVKMMARSGEKR